MSRKEETPFILKWEDNQKDPAQKEEQEQKEDKLPSKRARGLPTTRHDDFLWLDFNTNQ